jgi:hypothetical protein
MTKNQSVMNEKLAKIDAKNAEQLQKGLAQLTLQIINLLRKLMERQVLRRMESLSQEKQEELGLHLKLLNEKMEEMRRYFGIEHDELQAGLIDGLEDLVNQPLESIQREIFNEEENDN